MILKDLQEARDAGRRTQGGGGHGAALGEPLHAFCPARGDCADIGALDADRDPWAGDLRGLGGEGTVATARAESRRRAAPRRIVLAAALRSASPSQDIGRFESISVE